MRTAFERKMMVNCFLVLVLANFISFTGVLETLPELLQTLPIPAYLVFCLLFFLGCLVGGSVSIIAMGTPLAFAAIPGAGMPLMVLLMCILHAASQVQPTHICLVMITDYFRVSLGSLIRRTIVPVAVFCAFAIAYYNVLVALGL